MMTTIDWEPYLKEVEKEYEHWKNHYTQTDAMYLGKRESNDNEVERPEFLVDSLSRILMQNEAYGLKRKEKNAGTNKALEEMKKLAPEHVLLIGGAGCGKSATLHRFMRDKAVEALEILEHQKKRKNDENQQAGVKIPVLIELRYLSRQKNVYTIIRESIERLAPNYQMILMDELIKVNLRDKKFILLFDGVNEVLFKESLRELRGFRENNKYTPMIFTTRECGAMELGICQVLEMRPLADEQIETFVDNHMKDAAQKGMFLKTFWALNKKNRDLGRNPLFLKMFCADFINKPQGYAPHLGRMLDKFTKQYTTEMSRKMLNQLAFKMMKRNVEGSYRGKPLQISEKKAKEILGGELKGLLNLYLIHYTAEGQLIFPHETVLQYYAAEYIKEFWGDSGKVEEENGVLTGLKGDDFKNEYINEIAWTPCLVMLAELIGDEKKAGNLIEQAMAVDKALAFELAGVIKDKYRKEVMENNIRPRKGQISPVHMLYYLGKTQAQEALCLIEEIVKEEERKDAPEENMENINLHAIWALKRIKCERAAKILLKILRENPSWRVRCEAAKALGEMGNGCAIDALCEILAGEKNIWAVQYAAAGALEEIGKVQHSAVEKLLAAYVNGKGFTWQVGYAIAGIVGRAEKREISGNGRKVDILDGGFLNVEDKKVRCMATSFLGEMKYWQAGEPRLNKIIEALNKSLYDSEWWCTRYEAALALEKIGGEHVEEYQKLLDGFKPDELNEKDFAVIVNDIREIWKKGQKRTRNLDVKIRRRIMEILAGAMEKEDDKRVGSKMIVALGKNIFAELIDQLISIYEQGEKCGGDEAAGGRDILEAIENDIGKIVGMFKKTERCVRVETARVLGDLSELLVMIRALARVSEEVGETFSALAARVVSRKPDQPLDKLKKVLEDDKEWCVRNEAAKALKEIADDHAVEALKSALGTGAKREEELAVRREIVRALEKIARRRIKPSEEIYHCLSELLDSENEKDWQVRGEAAKALGEIGGENRQAVTKLLEAVRDDKEWYVRYEAAAALGKMTAGEADDEEVRKELGRIREEDEEWYVRYEATRSYYMKMKNADEDEKYMLELYQNVSDSAKESLGKKVWEDYRGQDTAACVHTYIYALHETDWYDRYRAARILGDEKMRGNENAIGALIGALRDEDGRVRSRAVKSLGAISADDEYAVDALVNALHDDDYRVRIQTAKCLGKIGRENTYAVDALIHVMHDSNNALRNSIVAALGEIAAGNDFEINMLILAMQDKDGKVRRHAAEALGKVWARKHERRFNTAETENADWKETAIEALTNALYDEDERVRGAAAMSLKELRAGRERDAHKLIAALNVHALARCDVPEIITGLSRNLDSATNGYENIEALSEIQKRIHYYNPAFRRETVILHLSDMHSLAADEAEMFATQLMLDLKNGMNCHHIDVMVISGDIADSADPKEYNNAKTFLSLFNSEFALPQERVIIVPGNHDRIMTPLDEKEGDRFKYFKEFYRDVKEDEYCKDKTYTLEPCHDRKLLILGLNSYYGDRIEIEDKAVNSALREIEGKGGPDNGYRDYLKIAVWHHPITDVSGDCIKNPAVVEKLANAGFKLLLHGHIHGNADYLLKYEYKFKDQTLHAIAAGAFGPHFDKEHNWWAEYSHPWQYNLINIRGDRVHVETRKRETAWGGWMPDARWQEQPGKATRKYYEFRLAGESGKQAA